MLRILQYLPIRRLGIVVLENILLVCCVLNAVQIRLFSEIHAFADYAPYVPRALVMASVFQLFLHFRDVYDYGKNQSLFHFLVRMTQALALAVITLTLIYYAIPDLLLGRGIFAIALAMICIFLVVWHTLLRIYLGVRAPRSNLLVLGTGRLARELVSEILRRPDLAVRVSGFLDENPQRIGESVVNPKIIGTYEELPDLVARHQVSRIAVEMQDRRGRLPIEELLDLKMHGLAIEDATSLYEKVTGKIAIENLKPSWMIFSSGFEVSGRLLYQKRVFSFLVSLVLLLLFLPVMLLLALLIKLESKGPVLYRQKRVGKDNEIFILWKFRSMQQDAEKESGPVWADPYDSRVTRIGRLMRRTRLDELPQLFNVLKGDMSLVGPRPERPHFVEELSNLIPFYSLRHSVKPGLTGWAQIRYDYGNSMMDALEKLQYDLFYIKNMSWLLDGMIIFETVKTVLFKKGS